MEFQQKEGYNPMAGCLPMLIQFPIIIFLYNVIRNPLSHICRLADESIVAINNLVNPANFIEAEKIAEKFKSIDQIKLAGMIRDYGVENIEANIEGVGSGLTRLPNFTLFGANLGNTPSLKEFSWLVLVPVIAAALTWLSMYLTRKWNNNPATQMQDESANASMKMMDLMMPAMTLWMAFSFSSMMGIYWIYQSALGILQTFIISKVMPLPKYTEEDVKQFKKAQKEAEKEARNIAKNAPKVRSLHYIDDDDYDSLPEVEGANKNTSTGQMDLPEI